MAGREINDGIGEKLKIAVNLALEIFGEAQMTATVLGKPKGLMSVATKVALQMNCKLGGEP